MCAIVFRQLWAKQTMQAILSFTNMPKLTSTQVKVHLDEAVASFPHGACLTCECFLGLTAQLSVDADGEGKLLLGDYKVERGVMHSCLGCDPCPPGNQYTDYMREKRASTLIQL